MDTKPSLLILGYARHGKDTVADILNKQYGFQFISSSVFVGQKILWPNWGIAKYKDFDEMFEDRVNHRQLWFEMIAAYNTPDKTRTVRGILAECDMYVGMRSLAELEPSRHLFDQVVWVDRTEVLPPETGSMTITKENANPDYVIDNNGDLADLHRNVARFVSHLEYKYGK